MPALPASLESAINDILSRAAHDIAEAAQAEIKAEVRRLLGAPAVSEPTPAAPKAARKSGAAPQRKPHPHRSYTQRDIDGVLGLIAQTPGLRSEDYLQVSRLEKRVFEKVLTRLRELGAVRTSGIKRAMTYRLP